MSQQQYISSTFSEYCIGYCGFGFNGKENDNEVKGNGNQQDYGMRIYDNRSCRFLSVDPLTNKYPWYTPYQFAGNTPIQAIDIDGLEPENVASAGRLIKIWWSIRLLVDANDIIKITTKDPATGVTEHRGHDFSNGVEWWARANYNKGKSSRTSSNPTTNKPTPQESGGSSLVNCWPLVVPELNDKGKLDAKRIGSLNTDDGTMHRPDGSEIIMDPDGNIYKSGSNTEIEYYKPQSIVPLQDQILDEDDASRKIGASKAYGNGARVFDGSTNNRATIDKTEKIKTELQQQNP